MAAEPEGVAVTVSIRGLPAPSAPKNREAILTGAVRQAIERIDRPVHVIVFPGGYLRYDGFLCGLSFDERKRELDRAAFAPALREAGSDLDSRCRGALLVVGIDTARKEDWGD